MLCLLFDSYFTTVVATTVSVPSAVTVPGQIEAPESTAHAGGCFGPARAFSGGKILAVAAERGSLGLLELYAFYCTLLSAVDLAGAPWWRALGGGVFDFFLIRFLLLTTCHAHLLHVVLENSTISLKNAKNLVCLCNNWLHLRREIKDFRHNQSTIYSTTTQFPDIFQDIH